MKLARNREHQVVIVRLRKPALRRVDPFLGSAIVALDASAIPASPVLLFNQTAVGASQDGLTVGFSAAFIEVQQGLFVARQHIVSELPKVFRTEPVEDLDELVHALDLNPVASTRI